jgi:zinc/manganese transport system substrate-binding protein
MRRIVLILLLLLVPAGARAEAPPLHVVASFSILGDLVRQIGGEDVTLDTLVGPDGDAHVFEPSPDDAEQLRRAQLFIVNGLGLEGWMQRLIESSGFKGRLVVASAGIDPLIPAAGAAPDPHAWQDIGNGRRYAQTIAASLEAADPAHAAAYQSREAGYDRELAALESWVRQQIGSIPPTKRKIITTHDAFGYFGRAYGVSFLAPVGMSEESEPDAGAVADLIRTIRQEQIKALFIENMTDPRLLQQLARETGTVPGGTLFADALSGPNEGGETYAAMFRHNVPLMAAAMGRN